MYMNRTIKKLICLGTAFIYILVSQFIAKAWLTTDRDLTTSESYCTNKKLDTYESKR